MIDAVLALGIANEQTVWQVGVTNRTNLPGRVTESVSSSEFDQLVLESDVTLTHSGVGSIMRILDLGKSPVVIPRARRRNEHVDDHQEQIAALLRERKLGVVADADSLALDDLLTAQSVAVKTLSR
ncbi:glycosyltransferase [Gordonia rubripertincta]|uniref:Glycosyltransferase n=2 Tax=Gordonia rubripertincta TaxID=36822 RepID=A0ABT4MXQ2_GORRU|nr:glycosyltransferase [Gordonia rubripertincta]